MTNNETKTSANLSIKAEKASHVTVYHSAQYNNIGLIAGKCLTAWRDNIAGRKYYNGGGRRKEKGGDGDAKGEAEVGTLKERVREIET